MDRRIVVGEFELQSRYYVHFRINTFGKGMNPLILLVMGEIASQLFWKDDFAIKGWYAIKQRNQNQTS